MTTRRRFIARAMGMPLLAGCTSAADEAYAQAVRTTWRHGEGGRGEAGWVRRELVRYATLAPSSHNTQCWTFGISGPGIDVRPDFARRCPVVDPDDHHLFVSLGCAAENLVQAALAHGLKGELRIDPAPDGPLHVLMEPTKAQATALFEAIPLRQCTRLDYDGQPLGNDELRLLEAAGSGPGVRVMILTGRTATEGVLDYAMQANAAQIADPAFVAELEQWIRFNDTEALRRGDGLMTRATGNPSMPRWLGRAMLRLFYNAAGENEKLARQLRSSAGIAVFVASGDERPHRVEVGRSYQRFALQATALGIRNAMLNQPFEVARMRPQFAGFLGLREERFHLVVRFGRGPLAPRSLRRPVEAVLAG